MKRDPALVEYSKDHHYGLLLVWKIRQGRKHAVEAGRISRYTLHIFDTDLIHHFKDEERLLFNRLGPDNPMRTRAESDHGMIYQYIDTLQHNAEDGATLDAFALLLEQHIRFEERELFNYMQENLQRSALDEIATGTAPRVHGQDTEWSDHFWEEGKA